MTVFWPEPGELSFTEMFAGQVSVGLWLSLTVTVNEQLGPAVAVQVTVVAPRGKKEPDGGLHVTVPQPGLAVGAA